MIFRSVLYALFQGRGIDFEAGFYLQEACYVSEVNKEIKFRGCRKHISLKNMINH